MPDRLAWLGALLALAVLAGPIQAGPIPSQVQTTEYTGTADNGVVTPVSYTTGAAGHQLKWLPYRPAKPTARTTAKRLAAVAEENEENQVNMTAALQAVQPAPATGATVTDPFGDNKAAVAPPALLDAGAAKAGQPAESPSDLMRGPLEPPAAAAAPPANTAAPKAMPAPEKLAPPAAIAAPAVAPKQETEAQPLEIPSLEQELAVVPQPKPQACQSPKDLKPIQDISYKTAAPPGEFPTKCPLGDDQFVPRSWPCITFTWKASGLCHKPLYFEDVHAERYGHTCGPCVQPFISAGHFFLTIPALPYLMGVYPPNECIYPLGYYRPGNCAPRLLDPIPLSVRGALFEGGVATGLAFLIP